MPISGSYSAMELRRRGVLILCLSILLAWFFPVTDASAAGTFTLGVKRGSSYVYINEKEMFVTVTLEGGSAPYTVEADFSVGGESREVIEKTFSHAGTYTISRMPRKGGEWKITVTARDSQGAQKKRSVEIKGSTRSYDTEEAYQDGLERLKLTGDWRADLVTVAQFQLGYRESTSDYIEGGSGEEIGATRYGIWMGDPYSEWCATFLAYSMMKAGMTIADDLSYADVIKWLEIITDMGAYHRRDYQPQTGDIVFLIPKNTNFIGHMGVVEFATENTIGTIEGNVSGAVARRTYYLGDERIAGFASMESLMGYEGVPFSGDPPVVFEVDDLNDRPGYINRGKVNMRGGTDSGSERLFKNLTKGTRVMVMAEITINDEDWLQVDYQGTLGYIMSKYVDVDPDTEDLSSCGCYDEESEERICEDECVCFCHGDALHVEADRAF